MVSELAPVILFLKYLVEPGDLLILEEPESHLHPAIQRQMARGIARLVNSGVKVLITTHSDYFVAQINNLIRLSRASTAKRRKESYSAEDCLKADDVAAYQFVIDDDKEGSFVHRLPVTAEEGIPEVEFQGVAEALYEEVLSLQRVRGK
jgi:predicted ATPase